MFCFSLIGNLHLTRAITSGKKGKDTVNKHQASGVILSWRHFHRATVLGGVSTSENWSNANLNFL
jgi:hypothetical protein